MATQTTHLGLTNQAGTDKNHRPVINGNNDIVDNWATGVDTHLANIDANMAFVAVQSGNNWQLPSGKSAAIGEYIVVDGILGHATAAITGGSTNIVSGTNWTPETKGGLNALNDNIGTVSGKVNVATVTTVPYSTGVYYCTVAQTIGGVTIPAYCIYDCHVYGQDGSGTVIKAGDGSAWSIGGLGGGWGICHQIGNPDIFNVSYNNARAWGTNSCTVKLPNGGVKGQYRTYQLNISIANDGGYGIYIIGTQNTTTPYLKKLVTSTSGDMVSSVAYDSAGTSIVITFANNGYWYVNLQEFTRY